MRKQSRNKGLAKHKNDLKVQRHFKMKSKFNLKMKNYLNKLLLIHLM